MKNFRVLLFVGLLLPYVGLLADVRLSINVSGKPGGTAVLSYSFYSVDIALDEQGRGRISIADVDGVPAVLSCGERRVELFLEDNFPIDVSFCVNDSHEVPRFRTKGKREKILDYMNRKELPAVKSDLFALSFDDFHARLKCYVDSALQSLSALGLERVNSQFVEIERGRILYHYAGVMLMFSTMHPRVTRNLMYRVDSTYWRAVEDYNVELDYLADVTEYRAFLAEVARMKSLSKDNVASAKKLVMSSMQWVSDNYRSEVLSKTIQCVLASAYVDRYGIDSIAPVKELFYEHVNDSVFLGVFLSKCNEWERLAKGCASVDFEAVDVSGKKFCLGDFRGKYVYIDVWATWCAPCRRESSYLKTLAGQYADGNIAFVGLSIDSDYSAWFSMVSGEELPGSQLYLGRESSFQKVYKISTIPRFILLDPEGKIVDANMLRPSSPDIKSYLDRLL